MKNEKFKNLILDAYEKFKEGNIVGILYSTVSTHGFPDMKDIEWFTWKIGRGDIIENRNMNDLEQGKYDRYRDILDLLDEMEWGDINGMEWFKQ